MVREFALLCCFNARTGGLVKLSTLQTAGSCVLLFAAPLSASQTVALTLSSVENHADNTRRLKLFLNAPSNSAPAGLQWTFSLPPGLDIVGIEAGKAVKEAGKTLVCNGAKCLVYGLKQAGRFNCETRIKQRRLVRLSYSGPSGRRNKAALPTPHRPS